MLIIDEAIPQIELRIVPRILPKEITPVPSIPERIAEASERTPSETIGEKSMFPMRRKVRRENRFIYGSHTVEIKRPNLVNFKPGIQERRISIKHKIVYTVSAAANKERIV